MFINRILWQRISLDTTPLWRKCFNKCLKYCYNVCKASEDWDGFKNVARCIQQIYICFALLTGQKLPPTFGGNCFGPRTSGDFLVLDDEGNRNFPLRCCMLSCYLWCRRDWLGTPQELTAIEITVVFRKEFFKLCYK